MKALFYPRLAANGIRLNRRLYVPYILTGSLMVMMYYILGFLIESPVFALTKGWSVLMTILPLGLLVIAAFSVLFLFYTNAFLIRQRYREFGLYSVLGMDKRNISRIMVWESLFIGLLAIGVGLGAGILLSKAAELMLLNILHMDIDFTLRLGMVSLRQTPLIYGGIYLLLLIISVIRVGRAKPLELMQASRVGERIPRRTWLYAVAGIALLGGAYWLAVTIQDPLDAMVWFFVAVLMVILGTYLVFIAGSVVFCRLLQANRAYYYKPRHFVSVSSMVYRMKRNGAGLASICILLTMVLVMISSTSCLYFGAEDIITTRYPSGVNVRLQWDAPEGVTEENLAFIRGLIGDVVEEDVDLTGVCSVEAPGFITQDGITVDLPEQEVLTGDAGYIVAMDLADYNRITGTSEVLGEGECLLYCDRLDTRWETFAIEHGPTLTVRRQLDDFQLPGDYVALVTPTVYLVVNDPDTIAAPLAEVAYLQEYSRLVYTWRCGFDLSTPEAETAAVGTIGGAFQSLLDQRISYSVESREAEQDRFYDMYGSLFFLGIMLSIVFLLAAVLIIYYKQLSEGYEDQARFGIMQKVGMTRADIRRSINSQMLTVFFLPLLLAGTHLAFAFPFVSKIFRMFAFQNVLLSVLVNVGCFAVFGLFYTLVYRITSGTYFRIVSGGQHA